MDSLCHFPVTRYGLFTIGAWQTKWIEYSIILTFAKTVVCCDERHFFEP